MIRIPLCGRKEEKQWMEKSRSIPAGTSVTILKPGVPGEVRSVPLLLCKVNELERNAVLTRLD